MTIASIWLTRPTVEVLRLLLAASVDDPLWGAKIGEQTDLGKSTVSQVLTRLTVLEWVTPREEEGSHPDRPARVFWALTEEGRRQAEAAMAARVCAVSAGLGGQPMALTVVRNSLSGCLATGPMSRGGR